MGVRFETKIAVVLRDDLAGWQKANVTAFLVSGVAGTNPDTVGEPYRDASGNEYLPMFVQPVLVYEADAAALRRAYERALDRGVVPGPYAASSAVSSPTSIGFRSGSLLHSNQPPSYTAMFFQPMRSA
jgi:hypothetical protein